MNQTLAESIEVLCEEAYNDYKGNRGTMEGGLALVARSIGLLAFAIGDTYIPSPVDADELYSAATAIGENIAGAIIEHGRTVR